MPAGVAHVGRRVRNTELGAGRAADLLTDDRHRDFLAREHERKPLRYRNVDTVAHTCCVTVGLRADHADGFCAAERIRASADRAANDFHRVDL